MLQIVCRYKYILDVGADKGHRTCPAPWIRRLSALQPPLVSVSTVSVPLMSSTCQSDQELSAIVLQIANRRMRACVHPCVRACVSVRASMCACACTCYNCQASSLESISDIMGLVWERALQQFSLVQGRLTVSSIDHAFEPNNLHSTAISWQAAVKSDGFRTKEKKHKY